jgi:hypothetical protein
MSAFNGGFAYWQNINVFTRNVFSGQPSGMAPPSPPTNGAVFVTQDLLAGFVTQDGLATFVTQDTN